MIILVKTKHLYRGMAWLSFQKSSVKLEQNLTGGDCLSFVLFCFSLQYLVCTLCVSILCFFLLNQSSSGWKTTGPRLGVQVRSHQVRPEQEHHSQLQHRPYRQVGTIYFFDCCSSSTWNGFRANRKLSCKPASQPSPKYTKFTSKSTCKIVHCSFIFFIWEIGDIYSQLSKSFTARGVTSRGPPKGIKRFFDTI